MYQHIYKMKINTLLKYTTALGLVVITLSLLLLFYHCLFTPIAPQNYFLVIAFLFGAGFAEMIPKRFRAYWHYQKLPWLLTMIVITTVLGLVFWFRVVPTLSQEPPYLHDIEFIMNSQDILWWSFGLGFSYIFYMEICDIWRLWHYHLFVSLVFYGAFFLYLKKKNFCLY